MNCQCWAPRTIGPRKPSSSTLFPDYDFSEAEVCTSLLEKSFCRSFTESLVQRRDVCVNYQMPTNSVVDGSVVRYSSLNSKQCANFAKC